MAHFSKYYMLKFSLEHFSEPRKAEENVIKQKKKIVFPYNSLNRTFTTPLYIITSNLS